jgi:hypothetical protein
VVSTAEAAGRVAVLPLLADVQGRDFDTPHILIAERVGGMEDIPVSLARESGLLATAWCAFAAVSRPGRLSAVHCVRTCVARRTSEAVGSSSVGDACGPDLHVIIKKFCACPLLSNHCSRCDAWPPRLQLAFPSLCKLHLSVGAIQSVTK